MINGVVIKKLTTHEDHRGFFREVFRFPTDFENILISQMSHSVVKEGVTKAWHSHRSQSQWNYVVSGQARVALFDYRPNSKTYRELVTFQINQEIEPTAYFFPKGVLHGYKCQRGPMHIIYITSELYDPEGEIRISADDSDIGYKW